MRQLWANAYKVAPPPQAEALASLRSLLDAENAAAFGRARGGPHQN